MHPPIDGFYDRVTAGALVRGAAAAYGEAEAMAAWAALQGCDGCEVVRDERTDTLGFVAANEERGFVVFRGTRDLRNWLTDLDCRRVEVGMGEDGGWRLEDGLECGSLLPLWGGAASRAGESGSKLPHSIEVHEGFCRALDRVWGRLAEVVDRVAAGKRDLFFAGHSLGGALAMLAAARWTAQGRAASPLAAAGNPGAQGTERPTSWVYTFGQPRVGNGAWARWYDGRLRTRSFRVVHAEDVVARVPWLLGSYRHAGTEIFYDAMGTAHRDWAWWRKAPSDALGLYWEWKLGRLALLGDHHVNTYVGMLNDEFCGALPRAATGKNYAI